MILPSSVRIVSNLTIVSDSTV